MLKIIIQILQRVSNFIIKSNDDYLDELLKNPIDRYNFEISVEEAISNQSVVEVVLNSQKVEVSTF